MPEHSRIAIALAEAIIACELEDDRASVDDLANVIDSRLADIREAYKPEELARCPIVTHHGLPPCAFCITAAMREFILLPSEL